MQSSIRSETPRLVTISANPSSTSIPVNGGVQIDREVVVTTRKHTKKRASYSSIPPMTNGHARTQSLDRQNRSSVNRTRSESRMSEISNSRSARPNFTPHDTDNPVYVDTNRESMRALAEFLMTKEPPATNWMSIRSDDEMSLRTIKKYKVFGLEHKKRKRVPKSPRLMRLPDVAVAATTRQGSRHIAISIPLQYDLPELKQPTVEVTPRPQTAPRTQTSERGAVTVLKPVVEMRESHSSFSVLPTSGGASYDSGRDRAGSIATPPGEILGPEATRTLENYYSQLHRQQQMNTIGNRRFQIVKDPRVHVPGLDFTKSDQRYSTGTMYSTMTHSFAPGHSRGASSVSTSTSVVPVTGLRGDNFPQRSSSKMTVPGSIGEELLSTNGNGGEQYHLQQIEDPRRSMNGSFRSGTSSSTSPPTVFATGTADLARGYQSPGPQYFSRSNTPLMASAPNKKLPDLPVGAQIQRPSTAPLDATPSVTENAVTARRTTSVKDKTPELEAATKQTRLERVKARKMRDLAASRAQKEGESPTVSRNQSISSNGNFVVGAPITAIHNHAVIDPTQTDKRWSAQQDLDLKKSLNSLSPIMVVANLPPFTGLVLASDLPSPSPHRQQTLRKVNSVPSGSSMTRIIHTPPRSVHDEFAGSDSDTIPTRPHSFTRSSHSLREKSRASISPNRAANTLDSRRQERRSKRNLTIHEREMDKRLERLEKDNALLVSTLRIIAGSFDVLNRLLPENSDVVNQVTKMREAPKESRIVDRDVAIEVLMSELQKNANRVSRNSGTSSQRMRLEGSDDEGAVIKPY